MVRIMTPIHSNIPQRVVKLFRIKTIRQVRITIPAHFTIRLLIQPQLKLHLLPHKVVLLAQQVRTMIPIPSNIQQIVRQLQLLVEVHLVKIMILIHLNIPQLQMPKIQQHLQQHLHLQLQLQLLQVVQQQLVKITIQILSDIQQIVAKQL